MTANNQKIENILGDQQEVMAGMDLKVFETFKIIKVYVEAVEKIETDVDEMKKGINHNDKYTQLETDIKALQDRRNLDEMVSSIDLKKLHREKTILNFSFGNSTLRCAMPP